MKFLKKNFLRILKRKGLKQYQVAAKIGRDSGGLSKTLNANDFYWSSIQEIAKALEVEPWELVINYDAGEIGPLSQEQKALIVEHRRMAPENQILIENTAKKLP